MKDIYNELSRYGTVDKDKPLAHLTTLRIGGNASYVVYPENDVSLDSLLRFLKKEDIPYKFIGKGSDILASDDPYEGVIIKLDRHYNAAVFEDTIITVQAGASIIALAVDAMKHGLSGLEFACGIPGTVGGAIFMNAGAYKSSMADIVSEVFIYKDGNFVWMPVEECEFSYRSSIFQKHPEWVIVGARMHLTPENPDEISKLMDNRRQRRMSSQPLDKPSCGSVFRNPEGHNAWQLVESIGYRGKQIGGACVSDKHCNFIVNMGGATAQDYCQLVKEIQDKVKEEYGIELHTEMEMFNWQ